MTVKMYLINQFLTANSSRAGAVLGIMFSFCVFVTEHKLCRLNAINDNMEYQVGNSESIFRLSSAETLLRFCWVIQKSAAEMVYCIIKVVGIIILNNFLCSAVLRHCWHFAESCRKCFSEDVLQLKLIIGALARGLEVWTCSVLLFTFFFFVNSFS